MCERAPSPYAPPMWRRAGRRCARSALDSTLFEAAAMRAVSKDLMEMKAMEFKEELGVREEPVSGMDAGVATPAAARGDVAGGGHLADLQKLKGGPIERN